MFGHPADSRLTPYLQALTDKFDITMTAHTVSKLVAGVNKGSRTLSRFGPKVVPAPHGKQIEPSPARHYRDQNQFITFYNLS